MANKKPTIEEMVEKRAKYMLNEMLSSIDMHHIVTLDKTNGIIYVGGVKADRERLINLKAEAEMILNTEIWKLLYETPKELAQKALFINGETLDDVKKGRTILYTLSTQKNILEVFNSFKPK